MFDSQCGFPVLIFTVFTPAYGNVLVMHITRCDYQQHSIEMKTEEEGGRRWEDERQKMGEPPHTKLRGMDLTHRFSEIPGGSWRFLKVLEGSWRFPKARTPIWCKVVLKRMTLWKNEEEMKNYIRFLQTIPLFTWAASRRSRAESSEGFLFLFFKENYWILFLILHNCRPPPLVGFGVYSNVFDRSLVARSWPPLPERFGVPFAAIIARTLLRFSIGS